MTNIFNSTKKKLAGAAAVVALVTSVSACSHDEPKLDAVKKTCPVDPIAVVSTVSQWSDVLNSVGQDCIKLTTLVSGSVDPHEFEPTAADSAKFAGANIVVMNGAGYDEWAEKAVKASGATPTVINAANIVGVKDGGNPHIWYSPDNVNKVATAVSDTLKQKLAGANDYFDNNIAEFKSSMEDVTDAVTKAKANATGHSYAATEAVFDLMAEAIGATNATPAGYMKAAANESEPAPGDVAAFEKLLREKKVQVLVLNKQSENTAAEKLARVAGESGVKVVEVTESRPAGTQTFMQWMIDEINAFSAALKG